MNGMHTVHVRINDAVTGQPVPVRLRLTGPEGAYHAPYGRLAEFATGRNQDVGGNVLLGGRAWAYIDGACEVNLPAGRITVEACRGFEHLPLREEVTLAPGKLALRFSLPRFADLRAEGWYSGDVRCHFLTPHAALLEAAAEDLAVVNLLATECQVSGTHGRTHLAIPNIVAFSGQKPALESPGHLVAVNTHNTHPVLGSLGLLHCHRAVYPLSFGGVNGRDDWTLADWCDQCHRKNGLVVWTRTWHEGNPDFRFGEPLADLILGQVDAFEIEFYEDSPFDVLSDWYTLLGAGLRVPLVGSSGKDCNALALGAMRTYARIQPLEVFGYRAWIEAVRAGRTFATNGPLLSFTVNGFDPGATVDLPAGTQTVRVHATARSVVPFDRVEVIVNGTVAATAPAAVDADVLVPDGGWVAVRCLGTRLLPHRPAPQRVFAHTSPVHVTREGRSRPRDTQAVARLAGELERLQQWAEQQARCTDRQREHLVEIFRSARQRLR